MFIFSIPGKPIPQMQTRFRFIKGVPHAYNPCKKEIEQLRWQIRPLAPREPLLGAIELSIWFFVPIPKNTPKLRRAQMNNRVILPTMRPDEDNLAYLVTNTLTGVVYKDDSQVCVKHVYKLFSDEPRTVIKVREILQMQPVGYHFDESDL